MSGSDVDRPKHNDFLPHRYRSLRLLRQNRRHSHRLRVFQRGIELHRDKPNPRRLDRDECRGHNEDQPAGFGEGRGHGDNYG